MATESFVSGLRIRQRHPNMQSEHEEILRILEGHVEGYGERIFEWSELEKDFVVPDENYFRRIYYLEGLMVELAEHLKVGSYVELVCEEEFEPTRVYIVPDKGTRVHTIQNISPKILWPKSTREIEDWDEWECVCRGKVPF